MTQTCIYYNGENIWGGFGYCDLFNTVTGEAWELKKESQSRSCKTSNALAQLTRYTTGKLKHYAWYIYDVSYWSENNGILRYSYNRTETNTRRAIEVVATSVAVCAVIIATGWSLPGVAIAAMMV